MKVIKATQQMLETRTLVLGFQGENLRTQLRVDCSPTFAEYPNATPALAIKPPSGETYPVFVERDGNEVVWNIVANNLVLKGDGELQLTFYKDNVIAKTIIGTIRVNRSLQIDGEMPDVVATWIENANRKLAEVDAQIVELEGMVDTATDAATRAEQSASTASTKAEQAAGSAATATEKATEATNAAGTATAKAAEAALSATQASNSAVSAADSERGAIAKATEAAQSAQTATTKATEATETAQTATEKAVEASASATSAQASATDAAASATAASASETAAKASETAAETSATQAAQSAQGASADAQTATQKATEATQSATGATQSEQTATQKATEAAASAQAASDAKTAVEQTAEQLAESLEQIDQNTQDIAELDERKANIDGYYPDMTVGNAEQLNSSKYVENSEPYTFRTSGGSADIGNREYLDAVVGGTVAWNQAVRDEASENGTDFAPIVTVTDAVEDAAGVKVKIEPVQDLHGYDHPWPAGGGKNLVNIPNTTLSADGSTGNVSCALPAGTYTFAVTTSTQVAWICRIRDADGNNIITPASSASLQGRQSVTFTISQQAYFVNVYFNAATVATDFQIESGSTATSFEPYSNICPITGWDGVKVTRTGKNLFAGYEQHTHIKPGTLYTISSAETTGAARIHFRAYNSNGVQISPVLLQGTTNFYISGKTIMLAGNQSKLNAKIGLQNSDAAYIVAVDNTQTAFHYVNYNEIQLELGSTATAYEPYAGNTYDITLPTEAGTVYGGTLDITTGVLTVTKAYGTISYSQGISNRENVGHFWYITTRTLQIPAPKGTNEGFFCDRIAKSNITTESSPDNSITLYDSGFIRWKEPSSAVPSEYNAYLAENPIHFVYDIAQPITYTLTASQIRTFLGQNNIWADTGDLALTYTGTDEHLTLESGKKYLARINGTDSMLLGSGQEITAAKGADNVFDLTQMFGTVVADYVYGQGASFFRRWFPNAVYPYNAGELLSVEGLQSHDMVGFNQWDEEWELGAISESTGENVADSIRMRSKNLIPVLPGTRYYISGVRAKIYYYDASGAFLSATSSFYGPDFQFTPDSNVRFIRWQSNNQYGTTYKHDICISLAHNGSRNGEYEPYEKHSYPLDSSVVLRGIPKVSANGVYWDGDRYLPDGTVERRYGVVDLGTLEWSPSSYGFYAQSPSDMIAGNPRGVENAVVAEYQNAYGKQVAFSQGTIDKAFIVNSTYLGTQRLYIRDSLYTDTAAFKAAMSGVYLVYELATPTTETAQPYHSTQWVSDWGTEEFVSTSIVPVGHETRYPANLRDKLQHLPDAASGNGSYLITQTDGQMVLTPFPAPPSSAGNYVLKATVTGGVATYTWEVAT